MIDPDFAAQTDALRGACIVAVPDGLLFDTWQRDAADASLADAVSFFCDLVQPSRQGMAFIGAQIPAALTLESPEATVILRTLREDLVAILAFDADTPMGMIRLGARRLTDAIHANLPDAQEAIVTEEIPRAARLLEYLERYSPDPHAARMRLALQTAIPIQVFDAPDSMSIDQIRAVEQAIRNILGLDRLQL